MRIFMHIARSDAPLRVLVETEAKAVNLLREARLRAVPLPVPRAGLADTPSSTSLGLSTTECEMAGTGLPPNLHRDHLFGTRSEPTQFFVCSTSLRRTSTIQQALYTLHVCSLYTYLVGYY